MPVSIKSFLHIKIYRSGRCFSIKIKRIVVVIVKDRGQVSRGLGAAAPRSLGSSRSRWQPFTGQQQEASARG